MTQKPKGLLEQLKEANKNKPKNSSNKGLRLTTPEGKTIRVTPEELTADDILDLIKKRSSEL